MRARTAGAALCAALAGVLCGAPHPAGAAGAFQTAQYRDPSMPVPQGRVGQPREEPDYAPRRSRTPFALPTAPVQRAPVRRAPSSSAHSSSSSSSSASASSSSAASSSSDDEAGEADSALPGGPSVPAYNTELLRLSQILGSMHYLRPLCGAKEDQLWRGEMESLLKAENADGPWKSQLVHSFNEGYRSFERTYRKCTPSATLVVQRYMNEGEKITETIKTRYSD